MALGTWREDADDNAKLQALNKRGWIFNQPERNKRIQLEDYTGFEDLNTKFQSPENQTIFGQPKTVEQRVEDYQGHGPGRVIIKDKTNSGPAGIYFYPDDSDFDKAAVKSMQGWNTFFESPSYLAPLVPMVGGTKAMLRLQQFKNEGYYQVGSYKKVPFADEFKGTTINMNPIDRSAINVKATSGTDVKGALTSETSATVAPPGSLLSKTPRSNVRFQRYMEETRALSRAETGQIPIPGQSSVFLMTQPSKVGRVKSPGNFVKPLIYQSGLRKPAGGVESSMSLRQNFSGKLIDIFLKQKEQGITEHSRGAALREFKDFRTNTAVQTTEGVPKKLEGIKSAVQLMEELDKQGKLDANSAALIAKTLSPSPVEKTSSTKERLLKEQIPEPEGRAIAKTEYGLNPDEIDQVMKLWGKHARSGFGGIREVASQRSLASKDLAQLLLHGKKVAFDDRLPGGTDEDAGHFIPAKYRIDHPDKEKLRAILAKSGVELDRLADPATSALTGMSEERKGNIAGSNKPEHAMHTKLAQLMHVPTNWAEDLDYVIRKFKGEDVIIWKELYSPAVMQKALEFDTFASDEAAIEFFNKEIKPLMFKPDIKNIQRSEKYSKTPEWRDPDYISTDELPGEMTAAEKKAFDREMASESP